MHTNSKDNNSNLIWKAQSDSFFKAKYTNFVIFYGGIPEERNRLNEYEKDRKLISLHTKKHLVAQAVSTGWLKMNSLQFMQSWNKQ